MDEVDVAQEHLAAEEEVRNIEASRRASSIPKGVPGECDFCGEWSGRLIGGACAPCRDHYKLP